MKGDRVTGLLSTGFRLDHLQSTVLSTESFGGLNG